MIVETLTLRNWRNYREAREFRFADGLNVLVGPNEAGKSTVFEGLIRVLFDRHNSKAKDILSMQPLGSTLGPEARLVFRAGDVRYRVVKRFLVEPSSELYSERDGRFDLDHEGDRADERLRKILRGDVARGASRAKNRGLAQALWYLQRDEGLPAESWSEALHEGLGGLVKIALRTPQEEKVIGRILALYAETFTPTGRLSTKSELSRLRQEVEELEAELERRQEEMARADHFRRQLEELELKRRESGTRIDGLRAALQDLGDKVEAAVAVDQAKAKLEAELERAESASRTLRRTREGIVVRNGRCTQLRRELERAEESESQLQIDVRHHRRAAESHARRWEGDLKPKLARVVGAMEELRARLRLDNLEREAQVLRNVIERRRTLGRQLEVAERRTAELAAPRRQELEEVREAASELRLLEARVAAAAVRVSFELDEPVDVDAAPPVSRDADTPDHPEEYLVTAPTTFHLEGLGKIHIRGGDETLGRVERLEQRTKGLREALAAAFDKFGVEDVAGLEALWERRSLLDVEIEGVQARLRELGAPDDATDDGAAEADLKHRLQEVEREIGDLHSSSPQAVLPGIEGWAEGRTHDQLGDLESERRRLERSMTAERDAEQGAQQVCLQKNEELTEVAKRTAGLRSEIKALHEQNAEDIRALGTYDALERAGTDADRRVTQLKSQLAEVVAEYEQRVEEPRRAQVEAKREVEAAEREQRRLDSEITDRLARIEEVAALGVYSEVGDLEARLDSRRRRLDVVDRRARAAQVLEGLVTAYQTEQAMALTAPVAGRVNNWLERLTGHAYDGLALDEGLLPTEVTSKRYGEPLPLRSLSYGTYEQVVVLLRLAMGVLLSQHERQLVVLDDRLVNTDPGRLERMCTILEEAAEHCQILLATCTAAPYETLDACLIELPEPELRMPESTPDGESSDEEEDGGVAETRHSLVEPGSA